MKRIKRVPTLAARPPAAASDSGKVVQLPLPTPRFARDAEHFATRTTTTKEEA